MIDVLDDKRRLMQDSVAEDVEPGARPWKSLDELTEGLPERSGMNVGEGHDLMPKCDVFAEALLRQLMRVQAGCQAIARVIEKLTAFDFEFGYNDWAAQIRGSIDELDELIERVESMREASMRWLGLVNESPLVQLDYEAWQAVKVLAERSPGAINAGVLVKAAVLHLARQRDSDAVVAWTERERLFAIDRYHCREHEPRSGWPWTRRDWKPWSEGPEPSERDAVIGKIVRLLDTKELFYLLGLHQRLYIDLQHGLAGKAGPDDDANDKGPSATAIAPEPNAVTPETSVPNAGDGGNTEPAETRSEPE